MNNSPTWIIQCFARLKEVVGSDSLKLSCDQQTLTVQQLKQEMVQQFPELKPLAPSLLVACHGVYVSDQEQVSATDEIACFPPVSGG